MKAIVLYGADRCHKTQYYMDFFRKRNLEFEFLDVEKDEAAAEKLRNLYTNRRLNFPTITIDGKKLRNPRTDELEKYLNR